MKEQEKAYFELVGNSKTVTLAVVFGSEAHKNLVERSLVDEPQGASIEIDGVDAVCEIEVRKVNGISEEEYFKRISEAGGINEC